MEKIVQIVITVITGGVIWEGFKFFYPDVKQFLTARIAAKNAFYKHLDPILKSASELYGKLESLAKEDFSTFINAKNSNSIDPEHNQKYVLFLFAQFWAHIEYIRLESQYIAVAKIKKGNQLLRFIETFESRKHRIIDRSIQRIIGECLITNNKQKFKIMTLKEFLDALENKDDNLSKWIQHLEKALLSVNNKEQRQIILRFGVIVAALIDHFDPNHKTVRRRDIYLNKLNPRSKEIIRENLVSHYLPFLQNKETYYL
jgi:hypothetical protein